MRKESSERLLPFYFGSLPEAEILNVERELLCDPELLTEYLDLKRSLEGAREISPPSASVWQRIERQMTPRKRLMISVSVGAALAACLALVLFLARQSSHITAGRDLPSESGVLFDANDEPNANSGVL